MIWGICLSPHKMKIIRKVGIWLDHVNAYVIEFPTIGHPQTKVTSEFTHIQKTAAMGKSEKLMHNKEHQKLASYFRKITHIIKNYDCVVLFGPTDAGVELLNLISEDPQFANLKIELKHADKMTDNQRYAFVRKHFEMSYQPATF